MKTPLIKNILLTTCLMWSSFSLASSAVDAFNQKDYTTAKQLFSQKEGSQEANYYLGRIAFVENQLEQAEDLLEKALKADENNPDYHYWFARISARQASNASIFSAPSYASDARNHFKKALELDDKHVLAMRGLVQYYLQAPAIAGGSVDDAKSVNKKLFQVSEKEGLISRLSIYRETEDSDKALATAEEIANKFTDSARALSQAAFVFQGQKQYDRAIKLFQQASRIKTVDEDNDQLGALYQIGRTAVLSKQFTQQGVVALEEYLTHTSSDNLPSKNWARFRLAELYFTQGQSDKGISLANAAIESDEERGLTRRAKQLLKKYR